MEFIKSGDDLHPVFLSPTVPSLSCATHGRIVVSSLNSYCVCVYVFVQLIRESLRGGRLLTSSHVKKGKPDRTIEPWRQAVGADTPETLDKDVAGRKAAA